MDHVLVVVESPAKARTIKKYLGKGYTVKASVGHIRDLPKRELGIDVEDGFKPKYVNVRGKSKVIKELRDEAKKSDRVLLATDMDREGEAIAWHLSEILTRTDVPIKRIIFNEITKNALREAVEEPRDIDIDKVNAQQARRILDRLVGYMVSPVLWKVFYRGLSAGRVQSVGLRLVIERENAIRAFVPEEYWSIEGTLRSAGGESFPARLLKVDGEKPAIGDAGEAEKVLAEIRASEPVVEDVRVKEKSRNPLPPFITSTMQREAAARLGFSAKKTMVLAQQLYEGVELGPEGAVGLISYMRTDSTRVSDEAHEQGKRCLAELYGPESVFPGRRGFKKGTRTQDAHEAVRPTECGRTPESVKPFLSRDQLALYTLVWKRFLASIASPAVFEVQEVDIRAGKRYMLRANGRRLVKPGFLAVMEDGKAEEESWLPPVAKEERASIESMDATQHFTEPPARYNEASLIKELEERGIGRPSTYASILSIIQDRDYVEKVKGSFHPTELGEHVWRILDEHFQDIFEVDFTSRMETELDKVEEAVDDWRDVIRFFYEPLTIDLEKFKGRDTRELKKLVQEETDEPCPTCGKMLVRKWSRNGPFLACPGYPECKFTKSLEETEELDRACPKCGGRLVYKSGRFGRFIACSNYPDCRYTEAVTLGIPCPREGCDGQIVEKRSRRGKVFYGCNRYPKCDFASWDKPTDRKCPSCGDAYLVEKDSKRKGHFLRCPACKHEETS
ncbi:MAG: type I DNA topoisomerase [Candidatus Krumholzibacteriota bacterium]|nr:type I DNA topoisomerase [Candidatus Krumholzibacteriota bacterium]